MTHPFKITDKSCLDHHYWQSLGSALKGEGEGTEANNEGKALK